MSARIVVGVDGSEHSRRALEAAFDEARRRGAAVDVVHAYELPLYWGPSPFLAPVPLPNGDEVRARAMAVIDQTVGTAPQDLQVDRLAVHGPSAPMLLQVASGADLLVVGSRGLGGFAGLLLGSTGHQLIAHAPCPVLVVH